jgi:hypothetical protein
MPRAQGSRRGVQAFVASALFLASQSQAAPPTAPGVEKPLPAYFDQMLAPSQLLQSSAPAAEDAQLTVLKKIDAEDLRITGFAASRDGAAAQDYRLYLGVGYRTELGSLGQVTSRAFYGAGTFDGIDPNGTALPEEVRTTGSLPGEWMGADWKVETHLFRRHTLSAGVEYRQELTFDLLDLNEFLGKPTLVDVAQPERKVGLVTNNNVALSDTLALNVRLRYDEDTSTLSSAVAPRAELVYKPEESSSLRAVFDQTPNSSLLQARAYNPWPAAETETDRIRNYELAYLKALWERNTLRFSAYRYAADGLLVHPVSPTNGAATSSAVESATAQIDTTGFEVGMERSGFGGTHSRVSYAWQETTDWLAGSANGNLGQHLARMSVDIPILPKRLSTSIELQYIDFVGTLIGDRDRDYVIGNLTLASGTVSRDTRVTLGMHNLFGARETGNAAQFLSFIPPDGRSVRLDVMRKL